MREYSTPLGLEIPSTGSLTDDIVRNGADRPDAVAFARRTPAGWVDVTAAEFLAQVRGVAKGLIASGVGAGDRVGLLSRTRYEWTLIDYAIWYVGGVTVPIYESSSAEQLEWILADSAARVIVTETKDHQAAVAEIQPRVTTLENTWAIDDGAVELLTGAGADVSDELLEQRRSEVTPQSTATLIYTSGTTGRPKGCVLSHANFMFELGVAVDALEPLFEADDASTLLFLPLAHVFARIIQIGAVKAGVRLGHSANVANLVADLGDFRPTFILAVPRIFEKVFNTASQRAAADGRGKIFDRASDTAIAFSRATDQGGPGLLLRAKHALYDRLVFSKLRAVLGGRCEYAVSGGAPLGERLGHFYRGIGLHIFEGYGLTETTGAVTVNLPDATKIGTVGRPIPGTGVRIADDGELLIRGGQVFEGYWNNPEASAEVIADAGWFRTGDLGEIDDEGFLRITGRKKEILVTAGGKNVAPAVLEARLQAHPLISQCMVVGDGRPFIGALVTLDDDAVRLWAQQHGHAGVPARPDKDEELRAEIQEAVDRANRAVSRAESIRKFRILDGDWTEEGGQLTPSLKVKRHVVMRECRSEIEALYAGK